MKVFAHVLTVRGRPQHPNSALPLSKGATMPPVSERGDDATFSALFLLQPRGTHGAQCFLQFPSQVFHFLLAYLQKTGSSTHPLQY